MQKFDFLFFLLFLVLMWCFLLFMMGCLLFGVMMQFMFFRVFVNLFLGVMVGDCWVGMLFGSQCCSLFMLVFGLVYQDLVILFYCVLVVLVIWCLLQGMVRQMCFWVVLGCLVVGWVGWVLVWVFMVVVVFLCVYLVNGVGLIFVGMYQVCFWWFQCVLRVFILFFFLNGMFKQVCLGLVGV